MNILIVSPGVYPVPATKGGAVENLIEILIKSKEITQKHKITVYTVYEKNIEHLTKNIDCEFKYIKTRGFLYQIGRILRHIINRLAKKYIGNQYIHSVVKKIKKNHESYDIIIVENEPQYGLILEKIKGKAKLILHLHNDYLNCNTKNSKEIQKVYDRVFSISYYISNKVNEIGPSSEKSKVLYNGIDIDKFNTRKYNEQALREKYNLKAEQFIFMYVGRLAKEKGIKELIQAFSEINNESIKLLVVGNKQLGQEMYYKEIMKLSKKKQENIIFTGYVDYNTIPELYSIADVGVIPSICNEAFGLSTVEFLACGKPVIVSNKGALPEIIKKEKCGQIVVYDGKYVENLKEKMIYFLNLEKEKMKELKEEAVANSKKFTKEIYIQNFLKLIEEEKNEK